MKKKILTPDPLCFGYPLLKKISITLILGFSLWGKQCIVLPKWTFFRVLAHCADFDLGGSNWNETFNLWHDVMTYKCPPFVLELDIWTMYNGHRKQFLAQIQFWNSLFLFSTWGAEQHLIFSSKKTPIFILTYKTNT